MNISKGISWNQNEQSLPKDDIVYVSTTRHQRQFGGYTTTKTKVLRQESRRVLARGG